jgi:hypothetical protein
MLELDEVVLFFPELDEDAPFLSELDEVSLVDEKLLAEEELLLSVVELFLSAADEFVMSDPEWSSGLAMLLDSEAPQAAKNASDKTIDAM